MSTTAIFDGLTYSYADVSPANAEKSPQYILVRLLCGALAVSDGNTTLRQKINYSSIPPRPQTAAASACISNFLADFNAGSLVDNFLRNIASENRAFYQNTLSEFGNFFIQSKRKCHTAAFVFLYRALEQFSYSVPLLYCSTQREYVGTFNQLKTLFSTGIKGDLGLFNKFLNQGNFIDPLELDTTYQIDFASEQGHQGRYFKATTERFNKFVAQDPTLNQVEIKLRDVPELLITIRNRFFHHGTGEGQKNLSLSDIPNSDEYFACINNCFCNVLSLIALQSIVERYKTSR
jgi:hypothetical protein